jgi:hypothetical protein
LIELSITVEDNTLVSPFSEIVKYFFAVKGGLFEEVRGFDRSAERKGQTNKVSES